MNSFVYVIANRLHQGAMTRCSQPETEKQTSKVIFSETVVLKCCVRSLRSVSMTTDELTPVQKETGDLFV